MPPFVFPTVITPLRVTTFAWGDNGLDTLLCQFLNQPVCIKGFVGKQCTKAFIVKQNKKYPKKPAQKTNSRTSLFSGAV